MDHDSTKDILQAALAEAFLPPRQSVQPVQPNSTNGGKNLSSNSTDNAIDGSQESSISSGSTDESWKAEYESQVKEWRAQSAQAREKAEKERRRWEEIRSAEKKEVARHNLVNTTNLPAVEQEPEWETVSNKKTGSLTGSSVASRPISPSPADSRDLVTGESVRQSAVPSGGGPTGIQKANTQTDDSQKWEYIQSSITSFPSLSFPERTETPSPSQQHPAPPPPAPLSATLAMFDSTLSTRTRAVALFSSLAINMLLPFVNGVMLGFGEIFAKNVVMGWFGWKASGPGSIATTTGIGISSAKMPWEERPQK